MHYLIATEIDLFKNLAQYEYSGRYYDFHNNYNVKNIELTNNDLSILFQSIADNSLVLLTFKSIVIKKISLLDCDQNKSLTIDILYRGRFEQENKLFEQSKDGKGYFYLDFCEGDSFELLAEWLFVSDIIC